MTPAISRPSSRSLVCFGVAEAHDLAVEHHGDPVRQAHDLVQFDADQQDRRACVAQGDDLLVDELDRADVHPAGRLADQQQGGVLLDLAATTIFCWFPPEKLLAGSSGIGGRTSNFAIFLLGVGA